MKYINYTLNSLVLHPFRSSLPPPLLFLYKRFNLITLITTYIHVVKWFLSDGLMLNPSKTEVIVFGTGARLRTSASAMPCLTIAVVDIPFVDSVRLVASHWTALSFFE